MAFDHYYAGVPAEQREALRSFREEHAAKHAIIHGTEWTYYTMGQGEQVILWLVGGLRVADAAHSYIPLMQDHYRIIVPDYPMLNTMDELANGLAGLLDAEGIDRACVLSGSFGGMLAQVFVRLFPARVSKLVLSSTTAPDPEQAKAQNAPITLLGWLPGVLARILAKQQLYNIIDPPAHEAMFYKAYLNELFSIRLDKAAIISTLRCLKDYNLHRFSPTDLVGWDGDILIIDSADDATFSEQGQQAMRRLYPHAEVYTFQDAGHSPASTQQGPFFSKVREFFGS
ncbi:MAG: hypothetical protein CL607_20925 [Anaerolineaceae bacterium]|nr:hypothetical protein [Anaerolineaceae bacterium]